MICDITFHPSRWNKLLGIDFGEKFFFDHTYRIEADREMRRKLYELYGEYSTGEKDPAPRPIIGSDLLACGFIQSAILGCEVAFSSETSPEVKCANLPDDEVAAFTAPAAKEHPMWRRLIEDADAMAAKYGYAIPAVNLMGVQNCALDLRGQELFVDYLADEDAARHLLSECAKVIIETTEKLQSYGKYISGGVTGIAAKTVEDVCLTSDCSVEMISQDCYEEFVLPFDIELAKRFTPFGVHHCGATMEHVSKGYAKIPNLAFAEVGAGSDAYAVRADFNAAGNTDIHLNLRYSPVKLKGQSREQIAGTVKYLAGVTGKTSISCVGIDAETEERCITDFLEEASKA